MSKSLFVLSALAAVLVWLSMNDPKVVKADGAPVGSAGESWVGRPSQLDAPTSAVPSARPLFGLAASPFGQLDCSGSQQTSACNPDEIKDDTDRTLPISVKIQTQSGEVLRGQYQHMPELASNLLECAALSEQQDTLSRSPPRSQNAELPELATCDFGGLIAQTKEVKNALAAAVRTGVAGARKAYAEYLRLDLLEAVAALHRAQESGVDPAPSKQKILLSKAALREYLGTGALDKDDSKSDFESLQNLEAEPVY